MSKYFMGFIHATVLALLWWVYFYTSWNDSFVVVAVVASIATFIGLLGALGANWDI